MQNFVQDTRWHNKIIFGSKYYSFLKVAFLFSCQQKDQIFIAKCSLQ